MPELPDVEVFRRYFDATALHQVVTGVEVREPRMLKEAAPDQLSEAVTGRQFTRSARRGKNMFVELSETATNLLLHFGMTGQLKYFRNPEEEPGHTRVLFSFENGYHLAYDNMRMLGKVMILADRDAYIRQESLGPDALDLDSETFVELMTGKRGMIKSAFMDQTLIAGLGNIYSDEVLFQSRIHPKRSVPDLDQGELETLFHQMKEVLHTAIERQVNVADFPAEYLIKHRDAGETCPRCGGRIEKIKVSSRSTYYCTQCQK